MHFDASNSKNSVRPSTPAYTLLSFHTCPSFGTTWMSLLWVTHNSSDCIWRKLLHASVPLSQQLTSRGQHVLALGHCPTQQVNRWVGKLDILQLTSPRSTVYTPEHTRADVTWPAIVSAWYGVGNRTSNMQEEQRGHDMEEMDHFEFQAKQNVWRIATHSVRVLYIRATKRVPSKNPISGYLIVPVYFMRSGEKLVVPRHRDVRAYVLAFKCHGWTRTCGVKTSVRVFSGNFAVYGDDKMQAVYYDFPEVRID